MSARSRIFPHIARRLEANRAALPGARTEFDATCRALEAGKGLDRRRVEYRELYRRYARAAVRLSDLQHRTDWDADFLGTSEAVR